MAGLTKTLVCSFLLGISCPVAAVAYSYDEIVQMVQAEEKAFGRADYSKSLDQRLEALEAKEFGGRQDGSDSLRLRRICRNLGLPQREGSVVAAPYNIVIADKGSSTDGDRSRAGKISSSAINEKKVTVSIKTAKAKIAAHRAKENSKLLGTSQIEKRFSKNSRLLTHNAAGKNHKSAENTSVVAGGEVTKIKSEGDTPGAAEISAVSAMAPAAAASAGFVDNKSALYGVMFAAVLGIIGMCGAMIVFLQREKNEVSVRYARNLSYRETSACHSELEQIAPVQFEADNLTNLASVQAESAPIDAISAPAACYEPVISAVELAHSDVAHSEPANPEKFPAEKSSSLTNALDLAVKSSKNYIPHYEQNPFACLGSSENQTFLSSIADAASSEIMTAESNLANYELHSFAPPIDCLPPHNEWIRVESSVQEQALFECEIDTTVRSHNITAIEADDFNFEQLNTNSAQSRYNEISLAYSQPRSDGFAKLLEVKAEAPHLAVVEDTAAAREESQIGEIFKLLTSDFIDASVDDDFDYELAEDEGGDYRLSEFIIAISNFDNCSENIASPGATAGAYEAASATISSVPEWILRNGRSMSVISSNQIHMSSTRCDYDSFSASPTAEWGEDSYHALAQLLIDAAGMSSITKTRSKQLVVPQNIPTYGRRMVASRLRETKENDRDYLDRLRGLFSEC